MSKLSEACQCLSRLQSRYIRERVGVWIEVLRSIIKSTTSTTLHSQDSHHEADTFIYFPFNTCSIRTISPLSDSSGSFQTSSQHWYKTRNAASVNILMNDELALNSSLFAHYSCHSQKTFKICTPPHSYLRMNEYCHFYNMENRVVNGIKIFI